MRENTAASAALMRTEVKARTCDWLRDEAGVMVRMVPLVQRMPVQGPVQPVVDELSRPHVEQEKLQQPALSWEA